MKQGESSHESDGEESARPGEASGQPVGPIGGAVRPGPFFLPLFVRRAAPSRPRRRFLFPQEPRDARGTREDILALTNALLCLGGLVGGSLVGWGCDVLGVWPALALSLVLFALSAAPLRRSR